MKAKLLCNFALVLLVTFRTHGQGTLTIDQQNDLALGVCPIQTNMPVGQSFVPSLTGVGFIQLGLLDQNLNNGLGATAYVNLRSGSITGTILATSTTFSMPDNWNGHTLSTFYFTTPVAVTPGTTYYFDINIQAGGDFWDVGVGGGPSTSGTLFVNGAANSIYDTVFTEGIVVPEPSPAWLAVAGGAVFASMRWRQTRKQQRG
jgi:hypothetical protein